MQDLVINSCFLDLQNDEIYNVNGGSTPWEAAIALVALLLVVAKESFNAGRQVYRDVCK